MSVTHVRRAARAALAAAVLLLPPLAPRVAAAQGGRVTGVVTDAATAQPIEGVQVVLAGTGLGALTRRDGRYVVASVPAGTYTVVARRVGYQSVEVRGVAVGASATREVNVVMRTSAAQLQAQAIAQGDQAARDAARRQRRAEATRHADMALHAAPPAPMAVAGVRPGHDATPGVRVPREPGNTEQYAVIDENPFLAAGRNPLSTFSIDVDRASYANVRRFLENGAMPPKDAVRIEELVNYFRYDYAGPRDDRPLAIHTELAAAPWHAGHQLLRIGLQGRKLDFRDAPANNLVFLIDVSGSMQVDNKLPLLKQAFRLLVDELREQDRVAIVVYAGSAGLVLPSTSGAEKTRILAAIDALEAGGSTAGGAGIRLAYDVALASHLPRGNNRVILATDGDFNVGTSSDAELVRLVEARRQQGTFLTVLGFGMDNLKDSRLEQLADKGNGNYAYIDNLLEAKKTLVTEMGGTLVTIAKDVKLQVEFNPAKVAAYRLIGYENRALRAEDFADDAKDAGELGAGHTVTALYEIVPVGVRSDVVIRGVDSLRYQRPSGAAPAGGGAELAFVKVRYKAPDGARSLLMEHAVADRTGEPSVDFSFAAAVAEFGLLLRESEHRGQATWPQVLALAQAGRGADAEGYRADFIRLVERARDRVIAARGER